MLAFHPHGPEGPASPAPETIWIDMIQPSEAEIEFIEGHTGLRIPTLDDLSEIERSSQLSVDGEVLRLSAPVVVGAEADHPRLAHLGLILTPKRLVTVRFEEVKAFEGVWQRACPDGCASSSAEVFVVLLEAKVDRLADLLERAREQLDAVSRAAFRAPTTGIQRGVRSNAALRTRLQRLGRMGERVSLIRDSLMSIGRIAPFVLETAKGWIKPELQARLTAVRQDVESLNQFEEHLTNKVQFLLDAVLGFISIEQNDIFKVLTIASVVGIPPTLVASWYGMNFHNIPELGWSFGYPYAVGLLVVSIIAPLAWFKWRRWL